MPKVSVVVPTHNLGQFIGEAIQSVLDQSFSDFELLVIDDGSTDNTGDVVARFSDPRVRYVYQENRERSAARNNGIRLARGEYIAFLDGDDAWLPEKLELQVRVLDARPEVGLVYTGSYVMENGRVFFEQKCRHRGNVLKPLLVEDNIVAGSASSSMVRRACFDQIGLFDEVTPLIPYEDWDVWLRIATKYDFDYVPQPLIKCRVHGSNSQKQADKMKCGALAFFDKILTDESMRAAVRPVRRRVQSLSRYMIGRSYYISRDMATARGYYLRSLWYDPLRSRAWVYLLRSLLGERLTEMARGYRNVLMHLVHYRNAGS